MAVIVGRDGKAYVLETTTALVCSFCHESLDIVPRPLGQVNFTFDRAAPDSLDRGEYWYLHKCCAYIDRYLQVRWGWLSLYSVLGKGFAGKGKSTKIQKELQQRMPPGAYEHLYQQWLPAIKPMKILPLPRVQSKSTAQKVKPIAPTPIRQSQQKIVKVKSSLATMSRSKSWQALRFSILQRDGYRCLFCGASAREDPTVRLEVDHIIARSRGGSNDPENLWTLCYDCNRGKGVQEL